MVVRIERQDGIALVIVDNSPVNALSQAVRQGLWEAAELADKDASIRAVLLTGSGRNFIAGADIGEFDRPPEPPHLPDLVQRIERADRPWIAAINGNALGGGLEIALGCRFRVASPEARLGFPEVKLGLVPGAGGTVRLPRLVTPDVAVTLVTEGGAIDALKAASIGLVDAVLEGDLVAAAVAFIQDALTRPLPLPTFQRPGRAIAPGTWEAAERKIEAKAKGETAPRRALACVRQAMESDFATAIAFERATFLELRQSDQAKALRHVFFAERRAGRPDEISGVVPRSVSETAVIGGGTMGAGIAAALRDAGLPVTVVERDQPSLERGLASIRRIFEGAAAKGRITRDEAASRIGGIRGTLDYSDLSAADLVIEAVFEDLDVKSQVFVKLDAACRPDAILATNTSYLDPSRIASRTTRPERVIGLHFFSPANVMRLVEMVPTEATLSDVVATAFALARRMGKIPVRAGICDGFIGNRILKTTREQAERVLLAGSTPADIDKAMRAFGMPMGPFEAQDLGGLDIAAFQRAAARDRGETPFAPVADRLVSKGRLGQKCGHGWYDYAEGSRTPTASGTVLETIAEAAAALGQSRRSWTETEICDAIVLPMINEASAILAEGIALRAADIDLVEIHGYGFPRWRGGLMHYAESRGLGDIVSRLQALSRQAIARPPCDALKFAAERGRFPS